jgi:flagellar biosynthesis/type III secretory pathway protein FliH
MAALTVKLPAAPHAARVSTSNLQGLADARADARETAAYEFQGAERRDILADALVAALDQLEEQRERAQRELAHQAIDLAVEIASALLRVRIGAGEYDLERVVRGALADSGVGRGEVTVHLHPEDHAQLADVLFRTGTTLAVDPSLARGDVHLSTPRGLLVRDVEGSLDSIREQLLEDLVQ